MRGFPPMLSAEDRHQLPAGARAVLPFLLGVAPFGLVVGVAMVAGGIPPAAAMAMSVVVYAGASMLAAAQLLASETPIAVIVMTAFFINLRFMMYSASLRAHLGELRRREKALAAYLLADNAYALSAARFTEQPRLRGKFGYYLGAAIPVWVTWQAAVAMGVLLGARLPPEWKLEFAAPLAFIAMTIPLLRDRAMVAAALAAAGTVVLAFSLPLRLSLAVAALVGLAAGLLVERRRA
jgi:predicted branched-subunit amino acid permease